MYTILSQMGGKHNRVVALDGLRGLAILLVMLNHLPFNSRPIPHIPWIVSSVINKTMFASGRIGVQLFFILSGFLMVYLYLSPKSYLGFVQKRYTRILPLFLTICVSFLIAKNLSGTNPFVYITITLLIAFMVHIGWVYVVKPYFSDSLKKPILIGFLIFQAAVAAIYAITTIFYGGKAFICNLPTALQNIWLLLINSTLTFQFGSATCNTLVIGVMWSLAAEIMFYLLFPILCAPFIRFVGRKSLEVMGLVVILAIPMMYWLNALLNDKLGFSIIYVYYGYFFIPGMVLGYLYRTKNSVITKITTLFNNKLYYTAIPLFILLIAANHYLDEKLYLNFQVPHEIIQMIFAIPLTLFVVLALSARNQVSRIFGAKWIVFIGSISYSLYLFHSVSTFYVLNKIVVPRNGIEEYLFIIASFIHNVVFAWLLYRLVEVPYFYKTGLHIARGVRSGSAKLVSVSKKASVEGGIQ